MGHENVVKNSVILNKSGAVVHIATDGENDKYFAVVAKCGHVGNGYFLPICFAVKAKDIKSAIQLTKERSRVQRDRKDCILSAEEISAVEYYLLNYHNSRDPYLSTNYFNEEWESVERRRIIEPELLEDVLANREYRITKDGERFRNPIVEVIKTADMYMDYQTLQRAFAPQQYGDRYVFPKHVNFREVLDAYYGEIAVLQGILKNRSQPLVYYYQIFGEDNELKLIYSYGTLRYRSLNGKTVYVPLNDAEKFHLDESVNNNSFPRAKKPDAFENDQFITGSMTGLKPIDKFNKRLQKYREINKGKQFGEE